MPSSCTTAANGARQNGLHGPIHLSYNPYISAYFFSRNSIFLLQQISQNSVSACFFSEANGAASFRNVARDPRPFRLFRLGKWGGGVVRQGIAYLFWRKGKFGPGKHSQSMVWNELFALTKGAAWPSRARLVDKMIWAIRLGKWSHMIHLISFAGFALDRWWLRMANEPRASRNILRIRSRWWGIFAQ